MKKICSLLVFAFFYSSMMTFISCNKDAETPSVTTDAVSNITATTAVVGGSVKFIGIPASIKCGICWSSGHNPTVNDSKTEENIIGGSTYLSYLNSLTPNTLYFVRAYVTYSGVTKYGNEISFTTSPAKPVTLSTTVVSGISAGYANSGGRIISDGGSNLTETGICWGTNENPTTNDIRSKTSYLQGDKTFTVWITGLRPATKYYVRSYAINTAGTSYGNELNFTTLPVGPIIFNPYLTYGTLSDIDGNIYKTIQIGAQSWMAENLRTTRLNNGLSIPNVTDNSEWENLTTPGYSWYNNDAGSYKTTYGALYNWYAVSTDHLCPSGWHVPDDSEFSTLLSYLGNDSGEKMVEQGNSHWLTHNTGVTNESGFTVLPGGERHIFEGDHDVKFTGIQYNGSLWSSSGQGSSGISFNIWWEEYINLNQFQKNKGTGLTVRCIKDN